MSIPALIWKMSAVHWRPCTRTEAYQADITYGISSELVDYLRDNMVTNAEQLVQRSHYFAIIDEVDNVLSMRRAPADYFWPCAAFRAITPFR